MSHLLDTNIVSEWTKPIPDLGVTAWLGSIDEDRTYLSVVTFAEVRNGIELMAPGRRRDRLETWLVEDLPRQFDGRILVIDRRVAEAWGVMSVLRRRAGLPIGPLDAFVAATAKVHDLTLVTRNVRDFGQLGIRVFNLWTNHSPTGD